MVWLVSERDEQVLSNSFDLPLRQRPDLHVVQPTGQGLGSPGQGILPGRSSQHGRTGQGALSVESRLQGVEHFGRVLVLVQAHGAVSAQREGGVRQHRIPSGRVVQIDHL